MASGIAEAAKLLLETRDGVLYEPRAFWAVAGRRGGNETDNGQGRVVFKLPAEDFYNGENQPIVLRHLCLAPINVRQHELYAQMLERAEVSLRVPERQHYTDDFIPLSSWGQRRVWGPDAKVVEATSPPADRTYQSSDIFNVCRWDFTHTMVMPRQGTLEINAAPLDQRALPGGATDPGFVPVNIGVNEAAPVLGAFYQGNARAATRRSTLVPQGGPRPFHFPNWAPSGGTGATAINNQGFPAEGRFNARAFDRQNSAASGNGRVSGFQVHIDQLDYDNVFSGSAGTGPRPVSLATSLSMQARMVNGGTGRWWWKPGAPLALVCPTRTPAQVYELPVPITLTPGDGVEIELRLPEYETESVETDEFVIGVSLCGFAMVEN